MPVYEYACEDCEGRFEYLQSVTAPPREACERCGGHLVKLISNTSFVLKGGGWYKDGYASPAPKETEKKAAAKGSAASEKAKPKKDVAAKAEKPQKAVGAAG